jgi:hypothetical protein
MKTIRNNTARSLGIPGARADVLPPKSTLDVSDGRYDEMVSNKMVAQWFKRGMLSVDGEAPGDPPKQTKPASGPKQRKLSRERRPDPLPDGVEEKGIFTHHTGGGYYDVYVNGIKVTTEKVRGKKNAEEIAAEYETPEE